MLKKEYSYTSTSLIGLHNLFYGEFYLLSLLTLSVMIKGKIQSFNR